MAESPFKIMGYFDWYRSAACHSRSPANSALGAAPIQEKQPGFSVNAPDDIRHDGRRKTHAPHRIET